VLRLEGPALDARTKITLAVPRLRPQAPGNQPKSKNWPVTRGQLAISVAATGAAIVQSFPKLFVKMEGRLKIKEPGMYCCNRRCVR